MRNYFILDGVDSRDFGVYISGQGTFNASGRDYNIIPVPGRNGDFVGPEKRFANGTLTYPAFIYSNFKTNIEAFRNFLLSLVGYHDLVDSYHPDQIRKVLFQGPFNADVQTKNDAGKFDIEFICKPQRFLASGNEVTTFESAGETETFSGSVVTFDNPGGATVSALSTAINPVQDLHGYANPWPAGGGKNRLQITATTQTINGVTFTVNADGTVNVSGTASGNAVCILASYDFDGTPTILNGCPSGGSGSTYKLDAYGPSGLSDDIGNGTTISTSGTRNIRIVVFSGKTVNLLFKPMLRLSTVSDGTFEPYSNVCPISGASAANIVVSPTTTAGDGTTYTVQFGSAGTVYGGTLDVTTGTLTITWESTTINDELWSYSSSSGHFSSSNSSPLQSKRKPGRTNLKSSAYLTTNASSSASAPDYSIRGNSNSAQIYVKDTRFTDVTSWKAEMGNTQIIYELAEPQTYQLTPTEVQLLLGTNNVWSDTGDITATIAFPQDQFTITNPTLFDSQPFLRVYGTGTLGVNSQSVTITQADDYTDIDCEMMDCYKGTTNKNPYVQFTDYNFPVLKPGVNYVSLSGITKVEITPRWWIV